MRSFLLLLIATISCLGTYAQDTIRIGPSVHYSAEEVHRLSGKGFSGKYGQEHIVFSPNHIEVVNCYYSGSARTCNGYHYQIFHDYLLTIRHAIEDEPLEIWTFKKLPHNQYAVWREVNGLIESGIVDTLIPLRQVGPFTTTSLDRKDTLWQTNDFTCMNRRYGYYTADFNVSHVDGEVYDYHEVDTAPVQLNGADLPAVEIHGTHPCYSQPIMSINTITCIITTEGKIVNIEQALGGLEDNCAYTLMDINRLISDWGRVQPATRNGEPVNVRWFIKIHDLEQPEIHPSFADTEENRMRFLKSRKN
ncbi:hypothetical protein [Pontibacter sp. G13]|uniref:hypothetical protein n=1 Tax=Pontibacter sp. G13 TaxID=3074898 RepID=UPI00288A6F0E|nr:hypothetical protein [Pontibacter sp. G13]WNJ17871.1 hypothetical protein RJD25_23710 [Pontibacter sp. G13]